MGRRNWIELLIWGMSLCAVAGLATFVVGLFIDSKRVMVVGFSLSAPLLIAGLLVLLLVLPTLALMNARKKK